MDQKRSHLLLDTHIWLWYLDGSKRLPPKLRSEIAKAAGSVWLSSISIWEVGMLVQRGRMKIQGSFRHWLEDVTRRFPHQPAPLNDEVALVSSELTLTHRDPADRFLAATALVYGLTLVTLDERLTGIRGLQTRSR